MADDDKYPGLNRDQLTIPVQMQLFMKQKTFSRFFAKFPKSGWNLKNFDKKDHSLRFCISKITDSEKVVR